MEFELGPATREAYGQTLVELGEEMPNLYVLDADLSKSTMTHHFGKAFPDRFFNVGISEANMVGMAAGIAAAGNVVFASSFACFVMCKGFDQLRLAVDYSGTNVKIVGSHGGISIGEDGVSQMGHEDLGLALSLPSFTVILPCDEPSARKAVRAAAETEGPFYIRVGRPKAPIVYKEGCDFHVGRSIQLRDGRDLTIITNGLQVSESLIAAESLSQKGIEARVLDMHTVRPLDHDAVERAARETGRILVVEEHLVWTGLGAQVAMSAAERKPCKIAFHGLRQYAESGAPRAVLEKYGMTAPAIEKTAIELFKRD